MEEKFTQDDHPFSQVAAEEVQRWRKRQEQAKGYEAGLEGRALLSDTSTAVASQRFSRPVPS